MLLSVWHKGERRALREGEPGLGVGDETGGASMDDVGGREALRVPKGPWHISGISVRTLPALRYGWVGEAWRESAGPRKAA